MTWVMTSVCKKMSVEVKIIFANIKPEENICLLLASPVQPVLNLGLVVSAEQLS